MPDDAEKWGAEAFAGYVDSALIELADQSDLSVQALCAGGWVLRIEVASARHCTQDVNVVRLPDWVHIERPAHAAKEEPKKGSEVKNEKMWAYLMHQRVYIDDLVLCRLGAQ
jgi:hypothetical protein